MVVNSRHAGFQRMFPKNALEFTVSTEVLSTWTKSRYLVQLGGHELRHKHFNG
jgi:hypothetical protein